MRHGGRLVAARAAFPQAQQPWIDLSTGVNPAPWKSTALRTADASRLPDPADTAALEAAAALAFGAPAGCVAAVPGSDAALRLLPYLIDVKRVGVISPTYDGHAEAWAAAGKSVTAVGAGGDAETHEAVVLANPNNPDGLQRDADEIMSLAARMAARNGWLLVDEAFVDVAPDLSVAPHAGGRLIVLRSFGKFYGLPGLRLGFVVADPVIAAKVRTTFGDWPVSAAAVAAGRLAYADTAWQDQSRQRLRQRAARLDKFLLRAGFDIIGGTSLFRLAAHADAARCFQILAEAGILVRAFAAEPTWLRFGLPRSADWKRLEAALERCRP